MKNITDLRETLFETIDLLKQKKIDAKDAKIVGELSQTLINTAKAEIDFVEKIGGQPTGFITTAAPIPEKHQIAKAKKEEGTTTPFPEEKEKREKKPYEFAKPISQMFK